mmetsp:Transcript_15292/g.35356  ORF Transcript_15292/g.35356 Transcript_15292/m.35356 type:complete len:278 (-) Transcript_15292:668-1501(-)
MVDTSASTPRVVAISLSERRPSSICPPASRVAPCRFPFGSMHLAIQRKASRGYLTFSDTNIESLSLSRTIIMWLHSKARPHGLLSLVEQLCTQLWRMFLATLNPRMIFLLVGCLPSRIVNLFMSTWSACRRLSSLMMRTTVSWIAFSSVCGILSLTLEFCWSETFGIPRRAALFDDLLPRAADWVPCDEDLLDDACVWSSLSESLLSLRCMALGLFAGCAGSSSSLESSMRRYLLLDSESLLPARSLPGSFLSSSSLVAWCPPRRWSPRCRLSHLRP